MPMIFRALARLNALMDALVYRIGRGLSLLSVLAAAAGAACVVLMMLHVTADVAGRYLFNAPLTGTIVIVAHYYMVFVSFIAIGVAEEKRVHISVEIVTDLLPRPVQSGLGVISGLVTVGVICLVAIAGFNQAMTQMRRGATMEQGGNLISVWQSYWAIPVGAGLMALIAGYRVITVVSGWRSGLNETEHVRNADDE